MTQKTSAKQFYCFSLLWTSGHFSSEKHTYKSMKEPRDDHYLDLLLDCGDLSWNVAIYMALEEEVR